MFRAPSTSSESHPYKVVSLANASSDDVSPSSVARFIVEAIHTLCLDRRSSLRIHPSKVSVGSNGDWDLGLIKDWDIGYNKEWDLGRNKISHGAQLRVQPEWGSLEGIEFYTKNEWNLLVLGNLLKDYIQRSRLRLWSKGYIRRSRFRSQQRRTLYDQLWLICLIEMRSSIRESHRKPDQMIECFHELEQLRFEWSQVA
jgi:hypothetical protein